MAIDLTHSGEGMSQTSITHLRLAELIGNPENPRDSLGDVDDLAASIGVLGLLQPLLVVPLTGNRYMVIDGHRRHAAMLSIGYDKPIPAVVTEMDAEERLVAAVAAGSFARPLGPIDQAKAFKKLTEMGLTQTQIAERTGVHQVTVSARMRLLLLSAEEQQALNDGRMTLTAGMEATRKIKKRASRRLLTPRPAGSTCSCGGGLPRLLMLTCTDCKAKFTAAEAPFLNAHCMNVHGRRASSKERTPTSIGTA